MIRSDGAGWSSLQQDVWSPSAVRSLHSRGLHLLGASMTIRHLNISQADPKPDLAALDLNGDPIPLSKPGTLDFLPGEFFYSIYNPDWQHLLLEQGRAFIDYGAEGIDMDEPSTYGDLVFQKGGSFDSYSLNAFRDYLAEKYPADELVELFGIKDIVNFDFREYILENGLEHTWNVSSQNPLLITYEFYLFQNQGADDFLRRFAAEMRSYAREEYNRDFVFSFNNNPLYDFSRYIKVDYLDYLTGEIFFFADNYTRAAVIGKLAENAVEGQVMLLAETSHDTGELPGHSTNLVKYIFADIFSNANTGLIIPTDNIYTMRDGGYEADFVTYDLEVLEEYYKFMDSNRNLFSLYEPARIGVVHSSPSLFADRLPSQDPLWGSYDVKAVMEILFGEKIPFGMLVSGDGIWSEAELKLEDMQDYSLVILPGVELISDPEVEALLAYVEGGGVVLQINGFGSRQKDASYAQRPELSQLVQEGVHPLGQGTWHTIALWEDLINIIWNDDEKREVQLTERTTDDSAAAAVREAIAQYHTAEIITDAPYSTAIRKYYDGENWVLHLVNYQYDQTSDQFTPTGPFQVSVDVGSSLIGKTKYFDFETGEITELKFTQEDNLVSFEIPTLQVYSIVELLP